MLQQGSWLCRAIKSWNASLPACPLQLHAQQCLLAACRRQTMKSGCAGALLRSLQAHPAHEPAASLLGPCCTAAAAAAAPPCRTCHIVVGTPGRLGALVSSGALQLSRTRCLVLDEADQLLGDAFYTDTAWLLSQLPIKRQARTHARTPINACACVLG